jgi:hypothetical protein
MEALDLIMHFLKVIIEDMDLNKVCILPKVVLVLNNPVMLNNQLKDIHLKVDILLNMEDIKINLFLNQPMNIL